jgi:hypothetical protein
MRALVLSVGALAALAFGCSENPLDPSKKGELKTAVGNIDTISTPAEDCDGTCGAVWRCIGYASYDACYSECLNLSREEQIALATAANREDPCTAVTDAINQIAGG